MADKIPILAPTPTGGEITELQQFGATDTVGLDNGGTGKSATDVADLMDHLSGRDTPQTHVRDLPITWQGASTGYRLAQPRVYDHDRHRMVARATLGLQGLDYAGWHRIPTMTGYGVPETSSTAALTTDGPWFQFKFNGEDSNVVGMWGSDYESLKFAWSPHAHYILKTMASSIANQRWWIGFWDTQMSGVTNPSAQIVAAFRYDTADSDTTWRCITCDGTTPEESDSGITVAANKRYELGIKHTGTAVEFYAMSEDSGSWDAPVATHSTNIPATTDFATVGLTGKALAASITQSMRLKRMVVTHV